MNKHTYLVDKSTFDSILLQFSPQVKLENDLSIMVHEIKSINLHTITFYIIVHILYNHIFILMTYNWSQISNNNVTVTGQGL